MARRIRIGIIVAGVFIGPILVAYGCHSTSVPTSGVQTAPQAAAAKAPQEATGLQGTQPPVAADRTRQAQVAAPKPDESKSPVDLALRFSPGSTATYRAVMEQERTVTWQGDESAKPPQFKDGRSGTRVEMTFAQAVESVDADGNAVLRVTIEGLKYAGAGRNATLDFDSQAGGDSNRPLAKLIGQRYRIRLSRRAAVLEVVDAAQARSAVAGDSPEHQVAKRLLSDEEIKNRHAIAAMATLKDGQVRPGQQWSSIKGFSFGSMGSKSFERVYTLSEVAARDGRRIAVVEMKAIPAAAMADQTQPQQMGGPGPMFDSTDNYDGQLEVDLDSGQVREYVEQMRSEWVVADSDTMQGGSRPAAVKMTAMRLNRLELVK